MLIIPAIDIIGGKCVRLTQGNFSSKKIYFDDPVSVARDFEKQGAQMLHIIDLDGAKNGRPENVELILKIRDAVKIPMQVGGGIRNLATATKYLSAGINRIIIGTKALGNSRFLEELIQKFGKERIIVSLDVKNGAITIEGWRKTSLANLETSLQKLKNFGMKEIIITDATRDGTLTTPNFELLQKIQNFGFAVIAAGGISDITSIKKLQTMGVKGAILGKALYEGKISLPGILQELRSGTHSNLAKRIIPCLDIKNGRTVKGVNFETLRDAGNPVSLAKKYSDEGADELVFLDIAATQENRSIMIELVKKVAQEISIPFTVGGGISTVNEIRRLLQSGADKVSLNTAAVRNPDLISEAAKRFGSQCIVVAIDVKKTKNSYRVYIKGGSKKTELDAVEWAKKVEQLGAGEILLTSIDTDGIKKGFDLELLKKISRAVKIPLIASGGAGRPEDFKDVFLQGEADAALAASVFHYGTFSIHEVKKYLRSCNIPVRI